MFGSSNPFVGSSPHVDILQAPIPVDNVSRLVLLQELKHRGKAAVQAAQYPDAIRLYEKALEVVTENDEDDNNKEKSILEANISLCHQKMSYFEGAVETGKRATAHDPTYVKGWWRLGQAYAGQKLYQKAVMAMQEAIRLEPQNKALVKERDKFQKALLQQKQSSGGERPATTTTTTTTSTSATTTKSTSTTSATVSAFSKKASISSTTTSSKAAADYDEEDDMFSASDIVRGYKVVNGKKTSYFHNELSQDAAKLIGDIAPQKLDTTATQPSAAVLPSASNSDNNATSNNLVSSAWNKAGTWEEKDVSTWAMDAFKAGVGRCQWSWQKQQNQQQFRASVQKCEMKEGHASVAMVRGKKRYIYEIVDLQVEWQVVTDDHETGASVEVASGKLVFPEIDGTCSGVYEANASVSSSSSSFDGLLDRSDLNAQVCEHGLRDEIHGAINAWIELLKETY